MKNLLQRIKAFLVQLGQKISQGLLPVKKFFERYVFTPVKKGYYKATHNKVIYSTYTYVRFFDKYEIKKTNKRRNATIGYAFIFIWIIGYLIFSLYPVFNSLYLSFFNVRLDGGGIRKSFLWFDNYRAAFLSDARFSTILIEYAKSIVINVPVTIVFALIIAMLINQDIKGKGVWRTIFFIPVVIASGPVIGELMAQGATTLPSIEEYGFIDIVINNVGDFLASPIQALFDQILFVLWFAGIQILILLAGLQKIDRSIYEAAMIDGASPWEAFWKITLPSIKPLITISIIYTVVSMSVFSLNDISVYLFDKMFNNNSGSASAITNGYGYAAALAWIFFIAMTLIILIFVGSLNVRGRKAK